jgi:hypothetical protein
MSLMSTMLKERGKIALLLTVVLDEGQEVIEVRDNDHPGKLAEQFCKEKGLDDSTISSMALFIEQQLKENNEPQKPCLNKRQTKPVLVPRTRERLSRKEPDRKPLQRQRSVSQLSKPPARESASAKPQARRVHKTLTPPPAKLKNLDSSLSTKASSGTNSYQRLYEEAKRRKVKAQQNVED